MKLTTNETEEHLCHNMLSHHDFYLFGLIFNGI